MATIVKINEEKIDRLAKRHAYQQALKETTQKQPNKGYDRSVEHQAMRQKMKGKSKVKGTSKDPVGYPKVAQGADCVSVTNSADKYRGDMVTTRQGTFKGGKNIF